MLATESELTGLVEARLYTRIDELGDEIERKEAEIGLDLSRGRVSSSYIARGLLLAAWLDALKNHGALVLNDLCNIIGESEEGVVSAAWFEERFDDHVDAAVKRLLDRLIERRPFGVSPSVSERRRIMNVAVGIKSGARKALDMAVLRRQAEGRRRAGVAIKEESEWDDRLPLRRRRAFDRDLIELAKTADATGEPVSLIMIDLDLFKSVNDRYGHQVGDEVLLDVSRILCNRVARKGRVYRYGGEEIGVLLPNYSSDEAKGLAERLRKDVEHAVMSRESLRLTASLGVACLPDDVASSEGLLANADKALYRAKSSGRNCVRSHEDAAAAPEAKNGS
ncbi:MAG: GGDEF domain-containing protein [Vicinamibacteria bacterium]|nr:GGDEF domain-containing protein [Vicinamibacteria bacterium]